MKSSIVSVIFTSFPYFEMDFNLNNSQLASLTSVFYLFDLGFTYVWFYIFAKGYDDNKVLIIGSIIWIFSLYGVSFSQSYNSILFFLAIAGIGIESTTIFFFKNFIKIIDSANTGKSYSFYIVVQGMGGVFGVFAAGLMDISVNITWNLIFLFLGIFSTVIIIPISIILIIYESNNDKKNIENSNYTNPYDIRASSLEELWKNPINKKMLVIGLCMGLFLSFLSIWQQIYYQYVHGMSPIETSITYIFNSGGEVIGTLLGGIIIDKIQNNGRYLKEYFWLYTILIATILFLIGFIIPWKFPDINNIDFLSTCWEMFLTSIKNPILFIGFVTIFFAFSFSTMSNSIGFVILTDHNKINIRGTMYALINLEITMGAFIGPYIGGILADAFSWNYIMLIVPFGYLIIFLLIISIIKDIKMK